MSLIESIFGGFVKRKLGEDFEERVMQVLGETSCSEEEMVCEIVGHYQAIIQMLAPEYSVIKLDANDWLTITIDNTRYDLEDRSTAKLRKILEHAVAIEHLVCDFEDAEQIISQIEEKLNNP